MLNCNALLRSGAAVALLSAAGCGANGLASPSPVAPVHGGTSAMGKTGCQPDFTLTLTPASATITAGQTVKVTIALTSLCGLAGTINVGIHGVSPPPQGGDGFTFHQARYDIPLDANSTALAYITFGATTNTLKTTWTITIQGKDISGGCCYGLTHSANFALTVH